MRPLLDSAFCGLIWGGKVPRYYLVQIVINYYFIISFNCYFQDCYSALLLLLYLQRNLNDITQGIIIALLFLIN